MENTTSKRGWTKASIIGICVFALFMAALLFAPGHVAGVFTLMAEESFANVFQTYILGYIGASIVVAVMVGRLLERAGVTDGLVKLFTPLSRLLKMNPTVLVPAIYNFLGDVNAACKITAPILQRANTTRDEKRIAIVTLMQYPPSFGCFLFGISCLALAGVNAFLIIVISYIIPLFLFPLILKSTIYRDCAYKNVDEEIPTFTPTNSVVNVIFDGVIEGADVLFRIIVPTACAIFAGIAFLKYFSVWQYIEAVIVWVLELCNIESSTGIFSILVSGALSLPKLMELMQTVSLSPSVVVSSVMLGSACSQLVLPLSNIPIMWQKNSDLTFGEVVRSALLGTVMRLAWCAITGYLLVPLFM